MKSFLLLISIMFFSLPAVIKGQTADQFFNSGYAKEDAGDHYGAIADYTRAIELRPNYDMAYNNRGWAKYGLKDYSGAIVDFDKAIQLNPNNDYAWCNRGVAKWYLNDLDGACQDWNKAKSLGNAKAVDNIDDFCK
jgi:tetratricopeptide (TPR) repeat protein